MNQRPSQLRGWFMVWLLAVGGGCRVGREIVDERGSRLPDPVCWPVRACHEDLDDPVVPSSDSELTLEVCNDSDLEGPCGELTQGEVPASGAALSRVRMTLHSEQPLTMTLGSASLDRVSLELVGPVTLRFDKQTALTDVQIKLRADQYGEPHVALDGAEAFNLVILSQADRAGRVTIERSRIDRVHVVARELELTSVKSDWLYVDVGRLLVVDTTLSRAAFSADDALLTASELTSSVQRSCGLMTMIEVFVFNSRLGPCSEGTLRVYRSQVYESDVDGQMQSDASTWQEDRLGARAETTLQTWDSSYTSVNFCEGTLRAELGSAQLRCSDCEQGFDVCGVPEAKIALADNPCEALLVQPAPCTPPLPVRERPSR